MPVRSPSVIWQKIQSKRALLGLNDASEPVKKWWLELEEFNQDHPEELLNILEVLELYEASLAEFWLTYTFCMDQEVSMVLDYLILKKTNQKEPRELIASDFIDQIGIPLQLQ